MIELMPMITAKQAREKSLSVRDKEADLLALNKMVIQAAEKGLRKIRVPYEMVEIRGYNIQFKAVGLESELERLGYMVESKSLEAQFVDVWLEVSW